MSSWLPALRIARREARRAKGRSALVIVLIALPAMALTFAAVSYDMFTLTPTEQIDRDLGTADAELRWHRNGPLQQLDAKGQAINWPSHSPSDEEGPWTRTDADVLALLPAGSRVLPRWEGSVRMTTAAGAGHLPALAIDLTDPLTAGIGELTAGRAPGGPGEVALTEPASQRLGATIGEQVTQAGSSRRYAVVGLVEFPANLGQTMLFHPDGRADQLTPSWLIATPDPIGWEQVQELNQHGLTAYSRAVALDPPAQVRDFEAAADGHGEIFAVGAVIGGLAVLEIVLLVAPAFAVGARRRRRELALVAAGGGSPAQLRRIVLADGVVLGVIGAGVGIALGIVAAFAARPLIELYLAGARAGGYRVFPLALFAIAVVAVGTALLAALVPAISAARQPVVAALAGRIGVTRSRRRWLVLGLTMVAAGTVTAGAGAWTVSATLVLLGLALSQLGLVLCTPRIVGLVARLGARLPLAPRVALRDTARNRSSAAPAISAVMAAVAGAAAVGLVVISIDQQYLHRESHPPGTAIAGGPWQWLDESDQSTAEVTASDMERTVRAILPVAEVHQLARLDCHTEVAHGCGAQIMLPPEQHCPYWGAPQPIPSADQRAANQDPRCRERHAEQVHLRLVDDGSTLAAMTGIDPAALGPAIATLRAGGVVVTSDRYLVNGQITIERFVYTEDGAQRQDEPVTLPAVAVTNAPAGLEAVVSPKAAETMGMTVAPHHLLIATDRMPTQAERDQFFAAMDTVEGYGYVIPEPGGNTAPMLLVLAVAAGLIALGAAGIATGLAAADRRGDLATLGAIGASPRVRRTLALSQSGVIAGLGTGLGLLAGLGGATAVLVALNQRYASTWPSPEPIPITVPWLQLTGLLAVPVVAMLGAGLFTRARLPIERRTG